MLLAQAYLRNRDKEKAEETLKDILQMEPDHWTVISLLMDLFIPSSSSQNQETHRSWTNLCLESCQLFINQEGNKIEQLEWTTEIDQSKSKGILDFIKKVLKGTKSV